MPDARRPVTTVGERNYVSMTGKRWTYEIKWGQSGLDPNVGMADVYDRRHGFQSAGSNCNGCDQDMS
jgi:hypothetical protein